jgi:tetratricopeptide (TPR) repeat protein
LWGELAKSHRSRQLFYGLIGFYSLALSVVTIVRNQDFASEVALWTQEVVLNDKDPLGYQSLAEALNAARRYSEADNAYRQLLQLEPEFQGGLRSYLAFLMGQGRFEEALDVANKCLSLSRSKSDVTGVSFDLINLAVVYLELQDYTTALSIIEQPHASQAEDQIFYLSILGRALSGVGDHSRAIKIFTQMESFGFGVKEGAAYGKSLIIQGDYGKALQILVPLAEMTNQTDLWNLVGTAAAQKKDYLTARDAFRRAVELAPGRQIYRDNLQKIESSQ